MVQWLHSVLSLPRTQVQFLVRELRSHKPHSTEGRKEGREEGRQGGKDGGREERRKEGRKEASVYQDNKFLSRLWVVARRLQIQNQSLEVAQ